MIGTSLGLTRSSSSSARTEDARAAMELAFDDGWRSGWWRLAHKPHFATIQNAPRFKVMIERLRAAALN